MLFRTMMICAAIAAAMLFAPAFAASQKDHEDCSKAGGRQNPAKRNGALCLDAISAYARIESKMNFKVLRKLLR